MEAIPSLFWGRDQHIIQKITIKGEIFFTY